jgi:predicted GNAT family acetyltransferase
MSPRNSAYRCERASTAHADELLALFETAGSGCFCNYWYFEGDKNAWLERCYIKPEANKAALVARLAKPELCGVVALREQTRPETDAERHQHKRSERSERLETEAEHGTVLGWLNVSRAGGVPRLYDQRVYRNLPCFQAEAGARDQVYAVACAYVAESERGRGVARALLAAAIEAVREAGGHTLEAFPRAEAVPRLRPDEIWLGPEGLFRAAGFTPVSDFRPYPVLRLHLR